MKRSIVKIGKPFCLLIPILFFSTVASAAPTYNATLLNGLSEATAINDSGTVVGEIPGSQTSDGWPHGAKWVNGVVTDLGMVGCRSTVSFCWSKAYGLNNSGMIVGDSTVEDSWLYSPYPWPWAVYYGHEVVWYDAPPPVLIKTVGHEYGIARDANALGHIAGHGRSVDWTSSLGDYIVHGYLWISNSQKYEIGVYGQYSRAVALNDSDQLTGEIAIGSEVHAYLWQSQNLTDIGHLGGGYSSGLDISNATNAHIVGVSSNGSGQNHAFVWQSGNMTDLNTLPGKISSAAHAVNSAGEIVGQSGNTAVYWEVNNPLDLNSLVNGANLGLSTALDINENGQILAKGSAGYYLLTPEVSQLPAHDILVCKSGCQYSSIQTGIDAAGANETILVLDGSYNETIVVYNAKILISLNGAASTTIDANGVGGTAVQLNGGGTVQGFTITGGNNNYGGGVVVHGYGNNVLDNIISGNTATTSGGGVYTASYASSIIAGNIISNNSAASYGGGVYTSGYATSSMLNNTISGNSASNSGGGIAYASYSTVNIENNTLSNNSAVYGGGARLTSYANLNFDGNIVKNNSATRGGGVIINGYSYAQVKNSLFFANTADYGGAIYSYSYSYAKIANNTLSNNSANISGGGLFIPSYSGVKVISSILWSNSNEISGFPSVTYSLVQGGWSGTGNIANDPLFVNPAGENFRLSNNSPAIDSGANPSAIGVTVTDDLYNTARPQDGDGMGAGSSGDGSDYDMGAIEK